MNNNLTEIHDIPDEIENTIDTFDDDKSIMKSSVVGIGVGVSIGTLAGIAHYNHWVSLKFNINKKRGIEISFSFYIIFNI